ncbi:FAD-dependent oxidoreductase [Herbaspirillum sp. alder98]|uniref:FAD-dependent oxidoreductase n=1 Tax=Herbaspirillum sp. alder98 TaxID=2913096 RepID=UPI001CD8A8F8|nr:FAD-dependent oxidoreductase [Herbaspirillum sp. alder98]MCA1323784.1 FAD-dependent oxidoreductase [Herbaspirillum sp. alder98]
MTKQLTTEVLICGAGAAGLTLALELARRGISFRLIEKMDGPFRGSRGKGIQPRTQEIFSDLGLLDRLAAVGGDYPKERLHRNDGTVEDADVIDPTDPTPAEPYQRALMVPQFLTEGVMRERLAELGHAPSFSVELIGLVQDASGVTARVKGATGEETWRARWLVGADGGRSFVRHALDIGFPGKTLGVRAIVADVTLTGLDREAWHRFGADDMSKQIYICPLAGTDMFQLQGPIPAEGEIDLTADGLTALVAERTGRADIAIQSVSWASAYVMNARLADHYRVGHVFLIGDAAHIHPPTGGQGLNTSVQDAYNLGWKLAAVAGGAPPALLDSYEEERRPVAAEMLGLATRLLQTQAQNGIRRGREVKQLDIGYPDSSLALECPLRHDGLRAGDRAPDAPIRGAGGQAKRLFDLFAGGHWTLIGYGTHREAVKPRPGLHIHVFGPRGDVLDDGGHFVDAYHTTVGTWVLVRPDGYVGAIVSDGDLAALEDYFSSVGGMPHDTRAACP